MRMWLEAERERGTELLKVSRCLPSCRYSIDCRFHRYRWLFMHRACYNPCLVQTEHQHEQCYYKNIRVHTLQTKLALVIVECTWLLDSKHNEVIVSAECGTYLYSHSIAEVGVSNESSSTSRLLEAPCVFPSGDRCIASSIDLLDHLWSRGEERETCQRCREGTQRGKHVVKIKGTSKSCRRKPGKQ